MKKKQPLTNQQKSQRRREVMDEIARFVTQDNAMTWRRYETIIRRAYEAGDLIAANSDMLQRYVK